MAFLKQTYISGNLFVTGSENYISSSEFRGDLVGTASFAISASEAVHAVSASHVSPDADLFVKTLHVSGNAQVDGDLKVLGDLTYVGVQDLRVKDKNIELNVNDSGSAQSSVDGAGILMKGTDTNVELIYSASDDKLHINKQIAGTIDNADQATSASRADSAAEADKVAHKVTFKLTDESGTAAADVEFDGSEDKDFEVDLSALETKLHASASVADLQDQIDEISGGGTGSIDSKIDAKIALLNGDASAEASGTPVSGGVFVLSGVAINEASGTITSGSATSVEVEKAGEAAKAKAELLGADTDETSSMTLYGVKKYAAAQASDGVAALSESVATDFSASNAARVALSQSVSQSIADVASNALNLVESSSYIAVSAKADNKQTISAKTKEIASASVEGGDGLAVASDVKSYVDAAVQGKNVDAEGDEWVAATASANKVTVTTNLKTIAAAAEDNDGLVSAYDVKSHVSASVAALSASVATDFSASNARLTAVEATASANSSSIADLQAADATLVTTASFNAYTASQALVDATQSARLDALETASADYVQKAGDTMSGDLDMATNAIKFGDMKMVWNASDQAIEFVVDE